MNIISKLRIVAVGAALALAGSAFALPITPSSSFLVHSTNNNSNFSADEISALLGFPAGSLTELYKSNVQGGEEARPFSSSYETTYVPTSEPSGALIDYISGPSITSLAKYLYVKDGNANPGYYIFDLTAAGWNGTEDLVLSGFWPDKGAISHLTILGGTGPGGDIPTPGVPDGGQTVALLGLALAVIGIARRKLS